MRYLVISACEDVRTGKEFEKGDEFLPEPDEDQAERLVKAGCLRLIDKDAPDLPGGSDPAVVIAALRRELAQGGEAVVALNARITETTQQHTNLLAEFQATYERMTSAEARVAELEAQLADGEAAKARVVELEAQLAAAAEKVDGAGDGANGGDTASAKTGKARA